MYPEDPRETFKRHVWVSPFYEDDLAGLKDLVGVDRMLMGSDYPHAEGLEDPGSYIKDLKNFNFTDDECRLVMRDNGLELLLHAVYVLGLDPGEELAHPVVDLPAFACPGQQEREDVEHALGLVRLAEVAGLGELVDERADGVAEDLIAAVRDEGRRPLARGPGRGSRRPRRPGRRRAGRGCSARSTAGCRAAALLRTPKALSAPG